MSVPNDIKIYIGTLSVALSDETDTERVLALTSTLLSVVTACVKNGIVGISNIDDTEKAADLTTLKDCRNRWAACRKTMSYTVGRNDWKVALDLCSNINETLWIIILKYNLVAFKDNAFSKFGNWRGETNNVR